MDLSVRSSARRSTIPLWFPRISGQTALRGDLKLVGYIHHGTPQIWFTFYHAALNSGYSLASDGLVRQFPCISEETAQGVFLKFDGDIHHGTRSPGLIDNFWACSVKSLLFHGLWLVEQLPRICRQSADRIELKSGGQIHYKHPLARIIFWSHCAEFPPFLGRPVSVNFQTNRRSDWAQIW